MMERACFYCAIAQSLLAGLYAIAARDFWDGVIVFVFAFNWWMLAVAYRLHRLKTEKLFCEAVEIARTAFVEFVRRQDEFRP